MDPGAGSGWDEPPLDVQIPDDARELDRDVIAYHRELRARRRRRRLRRLTSPFSGPGTVMPLLASILAVCLVAGAMLSVATFSPATGRATPSHRPSATAASRLRSTAQRSGPQTSAPASASGASTPAASPSGPGASGNSGTARPSGSANSSAVSSTGYRVPASQVRPATYGSP
ncbi:MAG TPA: hypothetical protein VKG61_17535 [Streptosporangiaceae bacterium]|nr:hypothetical protein [Streptosporangiaceae bacterium]